MLSPIEQYLPPCAVLVPESWIRDFAVIVRQKGTLLLLDGNPIADDLFVPVGTNEFEVARVPVEYGLHVFDRKNRGFSIVIAGYDDLDSYAYLGGAGTTKINPNPPG